MTGNPTGSGAVLVRAEKTGSKVLKEVRFRRSSCLLQLSGGYALMPSNPAQPPKNSFALLPWIKEWHTVDKQSSSLKRAHEHWRMERATGTTTSPQETTNRQPQQDTTCRVRSPKLRFMILGNNATQQSQNSHKPVLTPPPPCLCGWRGGPYPLFPGLWAPTHR